MRLLCVVPLIMLGTDRLATGLVPSSGRPIPVRTFSKSRTSYQSNNIRRSRSACNLFFRSGENPSSSPQRRPLDPTILEELGSPTLSLPFEISIFDDDDKERTEELLTIRHMEPEDLNQVIKLCIDEFGSGPTASLKDFPWNQYQEIPDWWDRVYFEPSIRLALFAKMNQNSRSNEKMSKDPAILVLCRGKEKVEVVGLVEISLQPPEADRNPPTYPRPIEMKRLYSQIRGVELEGWVTNLLVDRQRRGLGYSKLLMAATEGIARSWGRKYIYLHADADGKSGRVSQALYKNLGYEVVVTDSDPQYEWMPKSTLSSIQMVDGVALLFYRKRL
jgi:ribosomal protein S18 acetylase RimI-like enzyme